MIKNERAPERAHRVTLWGHTLNHQDVLLVGPSDYYGSGASGYYLSRGVLMTSDRIIRHQNTFQMKPRSPEVTVHWVDGVAYRYNAEGNHSYFNKGEVFPFESLWVYEGVWQYDKDKQGFSLLNTEEANQFRVTAGM